MAAMSVFRGRARGSRLLSVTAAVLRAYCGRDCIDDGCERERQQTVFHHDVFSCAFDLSVFGINHIIAPEL